MTSRAMRRRTALGVLGAASVLAPFVPLMRAPTARAQSYPRRLLILFSPNGTIPAHFMPTGGELDFQLGSILEPLQAHRSQLTVLDGLRYVEGGPGNPHMQGPQRFLAGSGLLEGEEFTGGDATSGWGSHMSVDQLIAQALAGQTPYNSLHVGVLCGEPNVRSRMSYTAAAQPVPQQDSPAVMFEQLFGQQLRDAQALEGRRIARASVLDRLGAQLTRVRASHGSDDRHKLDAHLHGIRELERRLDSAGPAQQCDTPDEPSTLDPQLDANFEALSRAQCDLLVSALSCDLTRVATLMLTKASSEISYPSLDIFAAHHDLSHAADDDAGAQESLRRIHRLHAQQVSYLLDRLAQVPEGDGTLLDHTAILWGNEVAVGNTHAQVPIPTLLLGGAHGYFKRGRLLRYEGALHNRLLVSLCHYMGLDAQQSFGNLDEGQGPLPGLSA